MEIIATIKSKKTPNHSITRNKVEITTTQTVVIAIAIVALMVVAVTMVK